MNITEGTLATLREIAAEAGREIMAVYGTEFVAKDKADSSPLTEADLRADAAIRRGLETAFPGVFIMSEESFSKPIDGQAHERFFLVDPLDGTKEFVKRNGEFTVNIAFIEHGKPVAAVVYAPALSLMYYAARGIGAWKQSEDERVQLSLCEAPLADHLRVVASRSHPSPQLSTWLAALACEYKFVEAGSSLKFCMVAEGGADVYPRLAPTSQWDTAAAQCILEAAGGSVIDSSGFALGYCVSRPQLNPFFIASRPGLPEAFLAIPDA